MKRNSIWLLVFLVIIALSQLIVFINWNTFLSFLNFPSWLYYAILLFAAYLIALYFFIRPQQEED